MINFTPQNTPYTIKANDQQAFAPLHTPEQVLSHNPLEPQLRRALNEPGFLDSTIAQADVKKYLANNSYTQARSDYENHLLTLPGMVAHARNTMVLTQKIKTLQLQHPELDETGFQNLLGEKITDILLDLKKAGQLDLSHYQVKSTHKNGYAKYLLYSQPHEQLPYCFQLFVFAPKQMRQTFQATPDGTPSAKWINNERGQRTKLHNHIAPCASSVLQGTIEEALYTPIEGFRKGSPLAQETGRRLRETGSVEGFDETELNTVHRLENIGPDTVITVHYYREMDGVEKETDKAASLRQIAAEMRGKANVANLFRAVKPGRSADPAKP